ncbi:C-terminal binding protein [Pectinatus haikarae]|uniref:C-terminal binding protein n=1 Tax=Pectinatus haikarae TaxID=349096 RepID=UPI0018C5CDBE|nr:C-terminal binding protein [Pectinatus haikarae]
MHPLLWIIDDEWTNYNIENSIFKKYLKTYDIRYSTYKTFREDAEVFAPLADAVLSQINIPMDRDLIGKLKRCRIISNYGTGYNNVDLKAAGENNIAVGYIPGYCDEDIADYIISAVCSIKKPVMGFKSKVIDGQWGMPTLNMRVHRLSAVRFFIIGLGRIGQKVALKAAALGMKVLAYSPSLTPAKAAECGAEYISMAEGLQTADFVSIHMPYTKKTENFFGTEHFAQMNSNSYLINTARGRIVDQAALLQAVRTKQIKGAFLDVLANEPPAADEDILKYDDIHITPHISYYSEEALEELQRRAAVNAVKVLLHQDGADLVIDK